MPRAHDSLVARVQDEFTALRERERDNRRCPLCGRPIRGGHDLQHVFGTAVHARCARSRSTA